MSLLASYRRLLGNRSLARFLMGEFVSSIGDWLFLVALLVLVYEATSSAFLLAVVGAARTIPGVLLSIPAGILVDRIDPRRVLVATDLARVGVMAILAALVIGHAPIAIVIAVAVGSSLFTAFNRPAFAALLPSLARDETELGPANSAWGSLDMAAFIIGPAIAGLLVAAGGVAGAFLLNGVSFLVVAAIVASLHPLAGRPRPAGSDRLPEPGGARTSIRAVLPRIAGPVVFDLSSSFVFGGVGVLTVVIATDVLRSGDAGTGYLNAAFGVGGLLGSLSVWTAAQDRIVGV